MTKFLLRLLGFGLGLLAVYAWWIEPCRLALTVYEVSDPEQPLTTPIRVLLLTDWHFGRFSRAAVLQAKMEQLRQAHQRAPFDLILLGGDYVDIAPQFLPLLTPCLDVLKEFGVPLYAVLGNHDYESFGGEAAPVVRCLEEGGARVLRNQADAVTIRGQRVLVVGLEDLQEAETYYSTLAYRTPEQYQEAAAHMDWYARFDSLEPETPRLLLAHNPDAVFLPGRKPLAVLSGHTHGGQIMLLDWISRPLHRWLHPSLPPGSAVTWAGRSEKQGRTLIVSRGMEGSAVPLRLLRSPEAVVVSLR